MKMIVNHLARTPLLIRVVFVYVCIFVGNLGIDSLLRFDAIYTTDQTATNRPLAFTSNLKPQRAVGTPLLLEIDSIDLRRSILPGEYSPATDSWTLSNDSVYFATMTTPPNVHTGTTLLYGHNTWKVLEKVNALQKGDTATVTTDREETFTYRYTGSTSVLPNNTSVLSEASKTPRLVVMTCEGWYNERRQLHYFELTRKQ